MPAIIRSGNALAAIRSQAQRGDDMAEVVMALLNNTYYAEMTAAAEAGDKINVTIQIKDQDGQNVKGVKNLLVKSKPTAGAGGITDEGAGTFKVGSTTTEAWVQTDADGKAVVGITNANAEDNLVVAELDNGTTEMLVLTFA